jgi:uncharacterized surface protein with fasciclin (FAS1) repeats
MSTTAAAGNCSSAHKDIVDTATAAGDFQTLIAAVKAANLVDTLRSPGPFTVFAPTDAAFAKLPKKTLEELLEQPERLAAILKYHVVPGRVLADDVAKLASAKTALGQFVQIERTCCVKINDAKVLKTDIVASNGVIHVIDSVLLPANDIIETARSAGSFKTLLAALEAADLTDALRGTGPLTVFAPTDRAFGKLPEGTVEALLKDIPKLQSILTYHVVAGKVMASDVVKLGEAKTLQGQAVRIDSSSGVKINSARVVKADVAADNGVIHVIDEVLLPPSSKQGNAASPARELIEQAIHRGVALYNDRQHAACTAVYEVAAMGLLASSDDALCCKTRETLRTALTAVRGSHDPDKNAWTMRHALDSVYASLSR